MIADNQDGQTWSTSTWQHQPPPARPTMNTNGDYAMANADEAYDFGMDGSTAYDAPASTQHDFEMGNGSNTQFDAGLGSFDPPFYTNGNSSGSRPNLALNTGFAPSTNGFSHGHGQSSSLPTGSSAGPSAYETEQLETPYGFGVSGAGSGVDFSQNVFDFDPSAYAAPVPQYYARPPPMQPRTMSTENLPQAALLRPNKSFGDLMMESRASSASASGDAQGQGWQQRSTLDEIKREHGAAMMMHQQEEDMLDDDGNVDMSKVAHQVRAYVNAPNKLAHGERSIIVMTPKVAQKSYGTEKRYLCPQPQAVFIGRSWWTTATGPCPAAAIAPPIINISLLGEEAAPDVSTAWTASNGEDLTDRISSDPIRSNENPLLGKAAARNLHISNSDDKRRKVFANVSVTIPTRAKTSPDQTGNVVMAPETRLGTFDSREIKVISKPSKKKTNSSKAAAGSGDLNVLHGSTVSLFNRVRAQTSSTRYLAVEPRLESATGSDKRPFPNVAQSARPREGLEALTADASTWESFIIWLVDANRSSKGWAPPMQAGYPSTPVNAILGNFTQPICYNTTVILQSLTTGVVSPTLVVRRVEQASRAIGADGQGDAKRYCPPGEFMGDPVSQLHKIALEVYNPGDADYLQRDRRYGGEWVSCVNDRITPQVASHPRQWTVRTDRKGAGSAEGSSARNVPLPSSELGTMTPTSPDSSGSHGNDYFSRRPSTSQSSLHISPPNGEAPPTEGGPIRRQRTHSSGKGPLGARPSNRKRSSADANAEVPVAANPSDPSALHSWAVDVTDSSVWSIVSTEQCTYTFFIPSCVQELTEPITPVAQLTRYIAPSQPAEGKSDEHNHYTSLATVPLVTFYGHGFRKGKDGQPIHRIFYGDEHASHHEFRCGEVVAASEPTDMLNPKPVSLVRYDGQCIFPTDLTYPRERHRF